MIDEMRSVALVGRPNVGKSRLFNRLVGRRVAIVHDEAGVTRDVIAEEVGKDFVLMDTGGIGMKPSHMSSEEISNATEEQVGFAIQAATLILFVVDGRSGLEAQDEFIAETLRRSGKEVLVVVNKIDQEGKEGRKSDFYKMGYGEPIVVSAEHGLGKEELMGRIKEVLGPVPLVEEEEEKRRRVRICFAGRPNVGKSSLVNSLLKAERLIVSAVPGTTRDCVRTNLEYEAPDETKWRFQLIDTAGLRPKGKVDSSVEYFSGVRTEDAIVGADVVFLVVDALDGIKKQDKKVAGEILEAGRGLVVVVNKWDHTIKQFKEEPLEGYKSETEFRNAFIRAVRKELFFLPDSPIIFTSAIDNYAVEDILRRGKALYERMRKKLSTGKVNRLVGELMERQKPRVVHGKRFKVYYAVQVGNNPFRIKVFCNQTMRLEDSYKRYLEGGFSEAFQLKGCPIKFELVGKPVRKRR